MPALSWAAVLQCEQPEKRNAGYVFSRCVDAEYAALLFWIIAFPVVIDGYGAIRSTLVLRLHSLSCSFAVGDHQFRRRYARAAATGRTVYLVGR